MVITLPLCINSRLGLISTRSMKYDAMSCEKCSMCVAVSVSASTGRVYVSMTDYLMFILPILFTMIVTIRNYEDNDAK